MMAKVEQYWVRRIYHDELHGPFPELQEAINFIDTQVAHESMWDFDPPGIFTDANLKSGVDISIWHPLSRSYHNE